MATLLPEDLLIFEILTKLPVKSLLRFKSVSKKWMNCISGDRLFIDAHRRLQQQSALILYEDFIEHDHIEYDDSTFEEIFERELDPDEIEPLPKRLKVLSEQFSKAYEVDLSYLIKDYGRITFTSSCEGLVCLMFDDFPEQVALWNPATRQLRLLPSPPDCNRLWGVGIGLDEASRDWKVVRLCMDSDDPSTENPDASLVRAHVLSKGDTVWRDGGVSGIKGTFHYRGMIPVAAAGALHWDFFPGHFISGRFNVIGVLSYDLTDEVFRFGNSSGLKVPHLCNWRSSLASFTYDDKTATLSVASPSSCGGNLSWSKLVQFDKPVTFVWREHYIFGNYEVDTCYTLWSVDPEAPEAVRSLKQHIRAGSPEIRILDYTESITSVF